MQGRLNVGQGEATDRSDEACVREDEVLRAQPITSLVDCKGIVSERQRPAINACRLVLGSLNSSSGT